MKTKTKIILISILVLTVFIINLIYADNILHTLQDWSNLKFVAQTPSEGFLTYMNVTFIMTFIVLMPLIIHMIILYIRPALYEKEKKALKKILSLTHIFVGLFLTGIIFGTVMIFKIIIPYLTEFNNSVGYQTLYNAKDIISFILMSIFYTGLIFQIPIINYYLLKLRIIKIENIKAIRIITIVGALIIGSIITPPDVLSQIIFSLPMWLLFEISTIVWRYKNDRTKRNINYIRSNSTNNNIW